MSRSASSRALLTIASAVLLTGCYTGVEPGDWYYGGSLSAGSAETGDTGEDAGEGNEGDNSTDGPTSGDADAGDGDGDTTTGDGDGDTTTGDGDGDTTTGDGDGDTTTGDGDGDTTTGDGDTTTDTGDGDTGGDPDYPMPNNAYCNPVANWDPNWLAYELEVIELVNQARAQGGNCGANGDFGPSGPLTWHSALTCAARVHSKDMADNDFFSHTNLEGNGPGWRMNQAGYGGGGWGENIAAGYGDPNAVVQGWLDSDGHCANMLNPSFSKLGVGYANGNGQWGHYWTQNFGN